MTEQYSYLKGLKDLLDKKVDDVESINCAVKFFEENPNFEHVVRWLKNLDIKRSYNQ